MPKETSRANKFSIKLQLMLLFVALISPVLCNAEIYKWVDKNGNTHYSDIKPNETSSEKLKIKSSNSSKEQTRPQSAALALDERKSKELEAQAEKLKSETQKRELNAQCENIRNNLKTLNENSRIKINEDGKVRQLTQEEIEAKKQSYLEQLNTICSN